MARQDKLDDVLPNGTLRTVLSETTFGYAALIRLGLAIGLTALFVPLFATRSRNHVWLDLAAVVFAAGFAGGIAWTGHAAGGLGDEAIIHPAADVLHLIAAAAWVGALAPLAILLAATGHEAGIAPAAFTVVDGKLYLNFSIEVRAIWQKDQPGYIRKAEEANKQSGKKYGDEGYRWIPYALYDNPGYPFFIPGVSGHRPPHPPLDMAWKEEEESPQTVLTAVKDEALLRRMPKKQARWTDKKIKDETITRQIAR